MLTTIALFLAKFLPTGGFAASDELVSTNPVYCALLEAGWLTNRDTSATRTLSLSIRVSLWSNDKSEVRVSNSSLATALYEVVLRDSNDVQWRFTYPYKDIIAEPPEESGLVGYNIILKNGLTNTLDVIIFSETTPIAPINSGLIPRDRFPAIPKQLSASLFTTVDAAYGAAHRKGLLLLQGFSTLKIRSR
jgi:hypothetical protein